MDTIISCLLNYKELTIAPSIEDVAYSLKVLFMNLKYKNPQENNFVKSNNRCVGCDIGKLRKESTITFSLDDGSIVPANKTSLCNNSPVFEAMLTGNFKESEQNEVKICDISEKCLQHFVKLIDTYCECILPDDVNVLLELVSISDRYLVNKLTDSILLYTMNYKLNYKNCHIIFKWAKECKLPFSDKVSNDVIKYIFTSTISRKQLRKAIILMMDNTFKDGFIKDMIGLISSALYHESKIKSRK